MLLVMLVERDLVKDWRGSKLTLLETEVRVEKKALPEVGGDDLMLSLSL